MDVNKINQKFLKSSPFILSFGQINQLKLTVPWKNIFKESIVLAASDIIIEVTYNKDFNYESFSDLN